MSEQLQGPAKGQTGVAPGTISRNQLDLPGSYAAPETIVERKIAEIWRNAFNLDLVGREDDFFDLGGDSFTATLISTAITEQFGYKFQPSILMSRSSVSAISSLLESEGFGQDDAEREEPDKPEYPSHLVAVRAHGELPPLFLIHGRMGITFPGSKFLGGLDPQQPVYFIQALGYFDDETPPRRVPEIAKAYLKAMRTVQPAGPLNICSFCAGGIFAIEIAAELLRRNDPLGSLVLVDPPVTKALQRGGKPPGRIEIMHRRLRIWWKLTRQGLAGDRHSERAIFEGSEGTAAQYRRNLFSMTEIEPGLAPPMPGMARKAYSALQEAIYAAQPRSYEGPVNVISSRELVCGLGQNGHPWNRLLPRMRLHIGAETHSELFRREAGSLARKIQECVSMVREGPAHK